MRSIIILIFILCSSFSWSQNILEYLNKLRQEQFEIVDFDYDAPPYISNFRVDPTNTNRILFDSSEPITATTVTGFTVSGQTVSSVTIKAGQTIAHYLLLSANLDYWDNNTVRYEGGSDLQDLTFNPLLVFTMEYIHNQIPHTALGSQEVYYVNNTVTSSGNGLTEGTAFKTLQEALNLYLAGIGGYLTWVKATGISYNVTALNKANSGISGNPNAVKGYLTTIGDLDDTVPLDHYTVNIGSTHLGGSGYADLDPSKMPLFDGGDRAAGNYFYDMTTQNYFMWENLQVTRYRGAFRANGVEGGNLSFKNIILKDFGSILSNLGVGFNITRAGTDYKDKCKFRDIIVMNATINGLVYKGDNGLIDNVKVYSEESAGVDKTVTTDYYINIGGSNNIIKNSLAYKDTFEGEGHDGHGLAIRETTNTMEFNLIVDSEVVGIRGSVEFRNPGAAFNVAKRVILRGDIPNNRETEYGIGGVMFHTGANNNIFELSIVHDVQHFILFTWNTENNTAQINSNIIRNNKFYNSGRNIFWADPHSDAVTQANNNKIYNNIFDNSAFFSKVDDSGILTMTGNEWKNNSFTNIPIEENTDANNIPLTGHTFDNNHSWDCDPWLANLTPLTGTANISADPLFTNQASNIYTLQDISPLIDAGQTLTDVVQDYNLIPRPQGSLYDIGAYEFISTEIFDIDYQALLDYATTQTYVLPSSAQQIVQNQVVLDLKAEGAWIEYDLIYVPANDGSEEFGTLNWKDATTFQLVKNGTVTWTSNVGFKGDGTTGYHDTTWDAQTDGVKFTYNDARADIWIATGQPLTVSGNNYTLFGAEKFSGDSNQKIYVNDTSNARLFVDMNAGGAAFLNGAATDHTGLLTAIMKDDAVNEQRLYKGTTLTVDDIATAVVFDHANDIFIGALNDNAVTVQYTVAEWGWFSVGSAQITSQSALNTIISNYMTNL